MIPGRAALLGLLGLFSLAFVPGAVTAATSPPPAAGPRAPVTPDASSAVCSWGGERDQRDVNVGAPDLNAFYYASSVSPVAGTQAVISGEYPHARYFSFALYNGQGTPIASLYDQQIAPQAGSANPYRGPMPRRAGRRYRLRVVFASKPSRAVANAVYVKPPTSGTASLLLVLRIYLPTGGSQPGGGVPFPGIVTESTAGRVLMRKNACATISSSSAAATWKHYAHQSAPLGAATPEVAGAKSPPSWSRSFGSQFGNPQNAYLMTIVAHHYGQLVVIHARAPTFPNTNAGRPVYGDDQLRYWSVCTYNSAGQAVIGCTADYRAAVRHGWVTYVVSDPKRRPRNATTPDGITWLPWGPENAIQIVYRNMLPAHSYQHAVQRIANPRQPVRAPMGAYYPAAAYCSTATFQRGGWRACLH